MAKIVYPLAEVLTVKKRRVEAAEKVLREKIEALKKEEEILEQRKAERDKAKQHRQDKLTQLRDELDHGTTSDKVGQMKAYLKICDQKLAIEEKKVQEQQEQVKLAEKNVELAREELKRKQLEVDKLETHREDWEVAMRKELEIVEGREQDELGTVIFSIHQRETSRFKE